MFPPVVCVALAAAPPAAVVAEEFPPDRFEADNPEQPIIPPGRGRWSNVIDLGDGERVAILNQRTMPGAFLPEFEGVEIFATSELLDAVGDPAVVAQLARGNERRERLVEGQLGGAVTNVVAWRADQGGWLLTVHGVDRLDAAGAAAANRAATADDGEEGADPAYRLPADAPADPWRAGDVRVLLGPSAAPSILYKPVAAPGAAPPADDPLTFGPGRVLWNGEPNMELWRLRDGAWTLLREGTPTVRPLYGGF